jgi:hypothetical protein
MTREPAVAGEFYENTFEKLNKQIEDCFYSKFGPGDLPVKRTGKKIKGVIAPHAGYFFSGACGAWAYKEIAESVFPRAYLILGPNHYGLGSGLSIEDWKTPFGLVKVEKDMVLGIKEKTGLKIAEENHVAEHSLEVQLPFLQYANRDKLQDIRIIPLVIGRDLDYYETGKKLADFLKNKDIVVIISSDFTHYGPSYRYVPFSTDIPNRITALDNGAIEHIMKLDTNGFKEYVNKTGITICGYMPILIFLSIIEQSETKPNLLMHYTSGDVLGSYKNSVSYVSIVFK